MGSHLEFNEKISTTPRWTMPGGAMDPFGPVATMVNP
jgi:hypothetical protein